MYSSQNKMMEHKGVCALKKVLLAEDYKQVSTISVSLHAAVRENLIL